MTALLLILMLFARPGGCSPAATVQEPCRAEMVERCLRAPGW